MEFRAAYVEKPIFLSTFRLYNIVHEKSLQCNRDFAYLRECLFRLGSNKCDSFSPTDKSSIVILSVSEESWYPHVRFFANAQNDNAGFICWRETVTFIRTLPEQTFPQVRKSLLHCRDFSCTILCNLNIV